MVETRTRPLSHAYLRPASAEEARVVERALDELAPEPPADFAEVAASLGLGVVTLLFVGPIAMLLVWAAEWLSGLWLASGPGVLAAAIFWLGAWGMSGAAAVMRRRRALSRARAALAADLKEARVKEEAWRFVEAVAYQEAEKLPLVYVLTADDGARVAFDETKLAGRERLAGEAAFSAAPSDAVLVRAPNSGLLISESYSGPVLPLLEVRALGARMRPQHGDVVG